MKKKGVVCVRRSKALISGKLAKVDKKQDKGMLTLEFPMNHSIA